MRVFGVRISPTAAIGLMIVAAYLVVALLAPLIAPYPQDSITENGEPWIADAHHWLGLDNLGRDIFSRLVFGIRLSVGLSLAMTTLAFAVGGAAGIGAAVAGGWIDAALSRLVDLMLAMPQLIFALVILSVMGSSLAVLIPTVAILNAPIVFRLARASAMNLVTLEFVEAARLRGEGWPWIVGREVLPNITAPLIAEFGLRFCFTFLFVASLSFLGLGVQPPWADLGGMVRDYAAMISYGAPEAPIYPAAAIAVLTVGVNFIVDWTLARQARTDGGGA